MLKFFTFQVLSADTGSQLVEQLSVMELSWVPIIALAEKEESHHKTLNITQTC